MKYSNGKILARPVCEDSSWHPFVLGDKVAPVEKASLP